MTAQKQYGFYVDMTKCTGCKACHIACKDRQGNKIRNDNDAKANGVPTLEGVTWRRVYEYGGGECVLDKATNTFSHNVFTYYASIGCNHCTKPECVRVCPTGAMHKRKEDGLVHIKEELCIGCESCSVACPYDAPQYDPKRKIMTKCDGCAERLAAGRKPICVEACPMRALDFDTMTNLHNKYGHGDTHVAPLPLASITTPNLVLKTTRDAKPVDSKQGRVLNPTEV